jgi:polyisoprenoid-binding protein YceI
VYTGEPTRDAHLRSADFFDVAHHPTWAFVATRVAQLSATEFDVTGDLTVRGVTRPVTLNVTYLGQWDTPWWENGRNLGPRRRAGFAATTRVNRHDFAVSWNDVVDRGGVVVSDMIDVAVDVEAVLESAATA